MARLNEPPLSTDSIETLRKKMLRQNRELAKCNNVRALRIRELEGELACAISENLELRGRILELENEAQDNEARRIADHAMAIKEKLESQLTEWGTLLAGLGLEPPMKRHSPRVRKSTKSRPSFSANRPSPSQRRLREVAREVEELGHISEHKSSSYSRGSMGPDQILALRSEADSVDSSSFGRPRLSKYMEREKVIAESPPRKEVPLLGSKLLESITFPSPPAENQSPVRESPQKKSPAEEQPKSPSEATPAPESSRPFKTGQKRKLDNRDDMDSVFVQPDENREPRAKGRVPLRDKASYGKSLKDLANMRRENRFKPETVKETRRPLAARSTNDDISSPKKSSKPAAVDEITAAKANAVQKTSSNDRAKIRAKNAIPINFDALVSKDTPPSTAKISAPELGDQIPDPPLLSPPSPSPEAVQSNDESRGDTPPPGDISSSGETVRPSRRNRATVSYAEPNLRDKMRRPTKELFDAVAGEGKSRRWSQSEPYHLEGVSIKRESVSGGESLRKIAMTKGILNEPATEPSTDSPLAKKAPSEESTSGTNKKRRASSAVQKQTDGNTKDEGDSGDIDVYEFESSSPKIEEESEHAKARPTRGKSASRRFSTTADSSDVPVTRERTGSRRRSMMV